MTPGYPARLRTASSIDKAASNGLLARLAAIAPGSPVMAIRYS